MRQLTRRSTARRTLDAAASAALVLGAVVACSDPLPAPRSVTPPSANIVAATNLPAVVAPTLSWLPPLGTGTADPATFDANAAPTVQICAWSGTACVGSPVARFATTPAAGVLPLTVNATVGQYEASWNLNDASFTTRKTYRIRVLQGTTEVGGTLIDAIRGRWGPTRADGSLAPLTASVSLPIRFWLGSGVVIPSTTKLLDTSLLSQLVAVDANTLTFAASSSAPSALNVGDVVVSGISTHTPYGLLRRITAKSISGNLITFQTTQAALTDAVQQGQLHLRNIAFVPVSPAVQSSTASRSSPVEAIANSSIGTSASSSISGSLGPVDFNGNLASLAVGSLDIVIVNSTIQQFSASASISSDVTLNLTAHGSVPLFDGHLVVASIPLQPLTFFIGICPVCVPVFIYPQIDVVAGLQGTVAAMGSTTLAGRGGVDGAITFSNGQFSVTGSTTGSLTADPISPQLDLDFRGSAGVRLLLNPYLPPSLLGGRKPLIQFASDAVLHPVVHVLTDPWWELFVGATAGADLSLEWLSPTLASYNRSVSFSPNERRIAQGTAHVVVTPSTIAINAGVPENLTAAVLGDVLGQPVVPLPNRPITWTPGDPALVQVTPNAGGTTASIKGLLAGQTSLLAQTSAPPDVVVPAEVPVDVLASVVVSPDPATVPLQGHITMTAAINGAPPGAQVLWTALDPSIVDVVAAGPTATVTGRAPGITRVIVSAGSAVGSAFVSVPAPLAVRLSPSGNVPLGSDPYTIEVVDGSLSRVQAPDDIVVTLVRTVHTCLGDNVFPVQRQTVIVPRGQSSVTFGTFVPGRYPACPGVQIAAKYEVTLAMMGASTPLDLSKVPPEQLSVNIIR